MPQESTSRCFPGVNVPFLPFPDKINTRMMILVPGFSTCGTRPTHGTFAKFSWDARASRVPWIKFGYGVDRSIVLVDLPPSSFHHPGNFLFARKLGLQSGVPRNSPGNCQEMEKCQGILSDDCILWENPKFSRAFGARGKLHQMTDLVRKSNIFWRLRRSENHRKA